VQALPCLYFAWMLHAQGKRGGRTAIERDGSDRPAVDEKAIAKRCGLHSRTICVTALSCFGCARPMQHTGCPVLHWRSNVFGGVIIMHAPLHVRKCSAAFEGTEDSFQGEEINGERTEAGNTISDLQAASKHLEHRRRVEELVQV